MLDEQGIEGIEIEDNVPLTEEDTKGMFIDEETELQRQYEIFKRIRMSKKDK